MTAAPPPTSPPPGPALFDSAPWLDLPRAVLGQSRRVPTMLSEVEERFYWWLGAVWAQDAGAVVDLGCFLGGSTARLAEGLRAGGRRAGVVAYDRFRVAERHKRRFLEGTGIAPFSGEDSLAFVEGLLAPWADRLKLVRGELGPGLSWSGGPVEILVIDIAKSAAVADAVAAAFLPELIPGRSVVVQQDFLHWTQPWLPVQMEALAGALRPVAHCPPASMAFLCEAPVTAGLLAAARLEGRDDAALARGLAAAEARYAPWGLGPRIAAQAAALARVPGARTASALRCAGPGGEGRGAGRADASGAPEGAAEA